MIQIINQVGDFFWQPIHSYGNKKKRYKLPTAYALYNTYDLCS